MSDTCGKCGSKDLNPYVRYGQGANKTFLLCGCGHESLTIEDDEAFAKRDIPGREPPSPDEAEALLNRQAYEDYVARNEPKKPPKPVFETEEEFWAALKVDRRVEHDFVVAGVDEYPDWWINEPEWEPDWHSGCFTGGDLLGHPEDFLGTVGEILKPEYGQLGTVRITIEIIDEPHDPWSGGPSVDYD